MAGDRLEGLSILQHMKEGCASVGRRALLLYVAR